MRDSALLPIAMVREGDVDLLPSRARLDFEQKMLMSLMAERKGSEEPKPKAKRNSSSLFSFGDFIFGATMEETIHITNPLE